METIQHYSIQDKFKQTPPKHFLSAMSLEEHISQTRIYSVEIYISRCVIGKVLGYRMGYCC